MKFHLFFSLAFVSGVHGFAIFLPYLLSVMMVTGVIYRRRRAMAIYATVAPQRVAPILGRHVNLAGVM